MSHEPRRIAQQGTFMHQIQGGAGANRQQTEENITDNLEELLEILPPDVRLSLEDQESLEGLLEVILDLGRMPEARFPKQVLHPLHRMVTYEDIEYVVSRVGSFGDDNRAGIERTLHRISAIRNRRGEVIGLTCRVGRAVQGTIDVVRDLVESGRSILIMGRPGVGKTTKLREIARILSDDMRRRVIVIDTSNEIAGDGDIPHPAIGSSRRMQVPRTEMQHAVMIEAVENHMPEVIVIDEISTQAEALAARTIAERGVQLIGTAHGNSIENLVMNPSLNDLIGGIQSVTLGDEEAKRRGTQKTVLERKAPPTFDIAIEIQDRYRLAVHQDVSEVVEQLLRGYPPNPEIRAVDEHTGDIHIVHEPQMDLSDQAEKIIGEPGAIIHIYPYAVSRSQLERVIRTLRIPAAVTKELDEADSLMILKSYAKSGAKIIEAAELRQIPVYIVKSNTIPQIQKTLREVMHLDSGIAEEEEDALQEARTAIESMAASTHPVELAPRSAFIRRMQHQLVEQYHMRSESTGTEPNRRIRIYPRGMMGGA